MCTLEDFKFNQPSTQEIIVFTSTALVGKHSVMNKQECGGLIGVCVWITLHQIILSEEVIQLQLGDQF